MDAGMKKGKIELLRLLLNDERIKSRINMDGTYTGEISIEPNGNVTIGKSKYGWVNRLFGSCKEIDFYSIASQIAIVITDGAENTKQDLVGLIEEIAKKAHVQSDREKIIDLLFEYTVLFDKGSEYYSSYIRAGTEPQLHLPDSIPIGHANVDFGGTTYEIPVTLDKYI